MPRPVTRSELVRGLRDLSVQRGDTLMAHTRMSALGWVVGGTQTVVESLLEALGPEGTLMAYVGWEDDPWDLEAWTPDRRAAYLDELPPFDPQLGAADPEFGRIPERIRTWPGARVSGGHLARMAAIGPRAAALTADAPWDEPFGAGSPLARLVDASGAVLMLGAPLKTLTLLHHAEALVDSPEKRLVTYRIPVREGDGVVWREVRDHDTSSAGAFPYEREVGDVDGFEAIARAALAAGVGRSGRVGEGESHLFPAGPLVQFAVDWLKARFSARE
jgi:aminoglycoside 3-N-acetyltransferase